MSLCEHGYTAFFDCPHCTCPGCGAAQDSCRCHETPIPQKCHACDAVFSGVTCPSCKEDRPAFALLKKISVARTAPRCRIYVKRPCDCGQRALCLEAA